MKTLSEEKITDIICLLKTGMPQARIAKQVHVSQSSVSRCKRRYLEGEDMDSVVAGDKFHGLLKAIGNSSFEGTCRGKKGRMHKKRFHCKDSATAKTEWAVWCSEVHLEEGVKDSGYFAREKLVAKALDKKEESAETPQVVLDLPTLPEPLVVSPVRSEEPPKVEYHRHEIAMSPTAPETTHTLIDTLYILAIGTPKTAGFFLDFQQAMQTEALMNAALEFAGVDVRYQVVEVKRYVAPTV